MKYNGNLAIRNQADADKNRNLTEVTGGLSIYSEAKLDAQKLESVGGDLYIRSEGKLDAVLELIGGYEND